MVVGAMTSAIEVAAYIRSRLAADHWKTQRLLYLAQAWSLGWTGKKLFGNTIEA